MRMLKGLWVLAAMELTMGIVQAAEGVREFRFGDVRVWALQDTATTMARTLFAAAGKPLADTFPEQFPASVNVFLVRSRDCNILIDAGYGPGRGALSERLAALGIAPGKVDAILLTHIHPDHVNGLLDAEGRAAFPAAKIYVAASEYASCRPELARCLEPYRDRLIRFSFGQALPGGLIGSAAPGHTPGHTLYRLGNLYFAGDIVHAAVLQFPHPEYCARYDAMPEKAVRCRHAVLQEASENQAVLFGAHIPFPGAVTVKSDGGGGFSGHPL